MTWIDYRSSRAIPEGPRVQVRQRPSRVAQSQAKQAHCGRPDDIKTAGGSARKYWNRSAFRRLWQTGNRFAEFMLPAPVATPQVAGSMWSSRAQASERHAAVHDPRNVCDASVAAAPDSEEKAPRFSSELFTKRNSRAVSTPRAPGPDRTWN